jgi:transposase InsO family protein
MQRMKQLARTAVYWPGIDSDIVKACQQCTSCAEHQNKPDKPPIHPWMLPEKPWSRVHIDHAIDFPGSDWLVMIDAYSKYPCIHPTSSTSTKATTELLEQDFAHFGYPHTIVTDNATSFLSEEFQAWCKDRGIVHLTGAPYHPATNGAAERLVQTFKQAMKKSKLPKKLALYEFLMQYRRTPLHTGYSPSELLNGRQLRAKIDTLLPSPAHVAQGQQAKEAARTQPPRVARMARSFQVGDACYALYCGPRRDKQPRWVPAVVVKVFGTRSVKIRVVPRGPVWRRHIEQLQPRFGVSEDADPGDEVNKAKPTSPETQDQFSASTTTAAPLQASKKRRNPRKPVGDEYGPDNPRRSARQRKPPEKYCCKKIAFQRDFKAGREVL